MITKTFTTLDLLNIAAWYKQAREGEDKKLSELPLKIQWNLRKIISSFQNITDNFLQMQQEAEEKIRSGYANDEKSYADVDEEGNPIRKIKEEYLEEFRNLNTELSQKLNEILMEQNEITFEPINIEALIDSLPADTKIDIDDMEIIGLFYNEPIEIVPSTSGTPVIDD